MKRLQKNVVIPAKIEGVLDQLHESGGGVFVLDGADEGSLCSGELDGFGVSREMRVRIDVNEPRGPETDHSLIALGENLAGNVVIDPIGLERAVHPSPVNPANDLAVIDAFGEGDRFAPEAAFQAVTEILTQSNCRGRSSASARR